uniref:Tetraspanin n=1 Tax=Geotrypetes seraphini TaxID=260995 RepID=A0A6P8RT94_GEOSA|nr:tetraspanin-8 [Geotrypetes seraphini]XP_033808739.1 tetraspanin-8 [Geotrypetes seraphini]
MAGVSKCLKYSMFFFNFLFWLCGCIILGVSIWLRVSKEAQKELQLDQTSGMYSAIDLLIAVGSIIMVLGFLGCCGAMRESRCMLLLFFIGLFLIFALQITAGILGAVYKPKIEKEINDTMSKHLPLKNQDLNFQKALEKFQQEQKCCGLVTGISDWGDLPAVTCSCEAPNLCTTVSGRSVYKKTCAAVIIDFVKQHMAIIIGIAFGLAVIEIVGLAFSMTLYCQIEGK